MLELQAHRERVAPSHLGAQRKCCAVRQMKQDIDLLSDLACGTST
jgi:hypothetical protein